MGMVTTAAVSWAPHDSECRQIRQKVLNSLDWSKRRENCFGVSENLALNVGAAVVNYINLSKLLLWRLSYLIYELGTSNMFLKILENQIKY